MVVLIAVLLGLKLAGIAGAIFALPFAAIMAAFFQHFLTRNAEAAARRHLACRTSGGRT